MPRAWPGDAGWRTEARLAGRMELVRCQQTAEGYLVEALGTRFFVRDDGKWIECLSAPGPESTWVLLGPALILALALQECWCLHAGAVVRSGRAILFLGESGCGKSTLTAWLDAASTRLARLADDLLPVTMHGRIRGLPPFPQFKLGETQQYAGFRAVDIDRVYVLRRGAAKQVSARRLAGQAAALALVRHTAGARLFPESATRNHLKYCSEVIENQQIFELQYPHTQEALVAVQGMVDQDR